MENKTRKKTGHFLRGDGYGTIFANKRQRRVMNDLKCEKLQVLFLNSIPLKPGIQWVVYVEQGGVDFIIEQRHQNTFFFVTYPNIMFNNNLVYVLSSLVTSTFIKSIKNNLKITKKEGKQINKIKNFNICQVIYQMKGIDKCW